MLAIIATAQLMVVLDSTIVSVALPHAQRALHISNADRQWVVTAYSLTFGALLLLGGRIADYAGRKRALLTGLVGFATVSAIGAAATTGPMLFAARAVQGAFAALLAPAALSVLTTQFPGGPDRRTAFATFGAISAAGVAVGLLLGGILTQYLSWRWTLLVNAPIALVTFLAALRYVPQIRARAGTSYDLPGVVSVSAGLASVVYGFTKAASDGWGSTTTIGFLAAGAVLLAAFVVIESRSPAALLPMRIPIDRNRGGSLLACLASTAAGLGGSLFLVYYLQIVRHYSPVKTGLAIMPSALLIIAGAAVATRLLTRLSPRVLMTIGALIGSGGAILLAQTTVSSSYLTHILPAEFAFGIGLGMIFTPLQSTATLGVRTEDAGAASALTSASQQIGGALGTAVFSTIYTTGVSGYLAKHVIQATTLGHALVHGYDDAFMGAAAAMAFAGLMTFTVLRRDRTPRAGSLVRRPRVLRSKGQPRLEEPTNAMTDPRTAAQLWTLSEQATNITWPLLPAASAHQHPAAEAT